ncbi:MAG: thermonuclease family protein [Ilumatobacteraceae bacterium]
MAGTSARTPLLLLALAGLVVAPTACAAADPSVDVPDTPVGTVIDPNAVVVDVVDGDTIDIEIDGATERVRLIGIDTPETVKPNTPVQCYGPEASAFTTATLPPSTPVRLERDAEARDAYGRLLAYVYRATDGLFVNLAIVAGGYARPFPFEPNTAHADRFADAALAARRAHLGLWGACSG